jgi:hypothetical protein
VYNAGFDFTAVIRLIVLLVYLGEGVRSRTLINLLPSRHRLVIISPTLILICRSPEDSVMSEESTSPLVAPLVVVNFILGEENTVMREDHVKNLFEDVCSLPLLPFTFAS